MLKDCEVFLKLTTCRMKMAAWKQVATSYLSGPYETNMRTDMIRLFQFMNINLLHKRPP
jgi:hypothetical protein